MVYISQKNKENGLNRVVSIGWILRMEALRLFNTDLKHDQGGFVKEIPRDRIYNKVFET